MYESSLKTKKMPLSLKDSKIHKEHIISKVKLCEFFVFLCLCGKIDF